VCYNIDVKGKEEKNMEIVYLTPRQEVKVLEMCRHNFVANGSSRAVYSITVDGVRYAVKVYLDNGGRIQSLAELRMYEALHDENVLAKIYAAGRNCLVCEWIDYVYEDAIDDFCTERVDDEYWESEFSEGITSNISLNDAYEQIFRVHDVLTDWCGDTADNTQIGWSSKLKTFVAYDYGYNTDTSRYEQVGHMEDYICNYGVLDEAISMVEDLGSVFLDYYDDPEYSEERHELVYEEGWAEDGCSEMGDMEED
jgi:hypothetical protein